MKQLAVALHLSFKNIPDYIGWCDVLRYFTYTLICRNKIYDAMTALEGIAHKIPI